MAKARIILLPFGANISVAHEFIPNISGQLVFDRSANTLAAARGVTQFGPGRSLYEEDDFLRGGINSTIDQKIDLDIVNYAYAPKQMRYILERLTIAHYEIEVFDLLDIHTPHSVLDAWLFDKDTLRSTLSTFAHTIWMYTGGQMDAIQTKEPTTKSVPLSHYRNSRLSRIGQGRVKK